MLNDPDIGIHFLPTEFEGFVSVLLTSEKFQSMSFFERQDSVWNYLRQDTQLTDDDISTISTISMENEAVEFI